MTPTLCRDRSPLLYETAISSAEHGEVGGSVVVPTRACGAVLGQQLARRRPREPAALTAEMCLVVVPGLDRPPCEIDGCGLPLFDRGLDAGDEALETQDAVQLLGTDTDRGPAAASELAFGDRQQRRQGGGSATAARHEMHD